MHDYKDEIKCWNCQKVPSECMGMACCHYGMPAFLAQQCDILSTSAEIKSDDAEVAALMMESDIQAPNKERMAWLQNENERLEGMLKIYKEKLADEIARNNLLNKKAKQSDEYFVLLAQCLHDVKV